MERVVRAIDKRQNVILSAVGGIECSRLLLRSELISMAQLSRLASFKRIYHFVSCDNIVARIHRESNLLPFDVFELRVCKIHEQELDHRKTDSRQSIEQADLIICPIEFLLNDKLQDLFVVPNSLIIFDGISIVSIESTLMKLFSKSKCRNQQADDNNNLAPKEALRMIVDECWSFILACNNPIDGPEHEFDCSFPISISHPIGSRNYRVFSSLVTEGPHRSKLYFGQDKFFSLIDEVGLMVEEIAANLKGTGSIVIFCSSLYKARAFCSQWQQRGLFAKIGMPYCCEDEHSLEMRKILIGLTQINPRSILIMSHRMDHNVELINFYLSTMAKVVISVGLPYPIPNTLWWLERIEKKGPTSSEGGHCSEIVGSANTKQPKQVRNPECDCDTKIFNVYRYLAIEKLNGSLRRCFGEFRYRDCALFIFDKTISNHRSKLTPELGDVHIESFSDALDRFEEFCRF